MEHKPYWSAKHIQSISDLPAKLTVGRAYFIDDEHYIIIDHGLGPVVYGNKSGPQGIPGEPIPELQAQIDMLAQASIRGTWLLSQMNDKHTQRQNEIAAELAGRASDITEELHDTAAKIRGELDDTAGNIRNVRLEDMKLITEQLTYLSSAVIQLTEISSRIAENLRNTESTLLNLLVDYTGEGTSTLQPAITAPASVTTSDGSAYDIVALDEGENEGTLIFTLKS